MALTNKYIPSTSSSLWCAVGAPCEAGCMHACLIIDKILRLADTTRCATRGQVVSEHVSIMDRARDTSLDIQHLSRATRFWCICRGHMDARARARTRVRVSPPALIRQRNYRSDLSRSIPSAGDSGLNVSLRIFDLATILYRPRATAGQPASQPVSQPAGRPASLPFSPSFLPMLLL